jgi:hypothetical protein
MHCVCRDARSTQWFRSKKGEARCTSRKHLSVWYEVDVTILEKQRVRLLSEGSELFFIFMAGEKSNSIKYNRPGTSNYASKSRGIASLRMFSSLFKIFWVSIIFFIRYQA